MRRSHLNVKNRTVQEFQMRMAALKRTRADGRRCRQSIITSCSARAQLLSSATCQRPAICERGDGGDIVAARLVSTPIGAHSTTARVETATLSITKCQQSLVVACASLETCSSASEVIIWHVYLSS